MAAFLLSDERHRALCGRRVPIIGGDGIVRRMRVISFFNLRISCIRPSATAVAAVLFAACCIAAPKDVVAQTGKWPVLKSDSIHDPRSPGVRLLQESGQALGEIAKVAPDTAGNQVHWVRAIEDGALQPLASLKNRAFKMQVYDKEVFLDISGSMNVVRFPHRAHTLWLDCKNCHDSIFLPKAGANRIEMYEILQGNQCGMCHGAVAFPLTECQRCHSLSQNEFEAMYKENRLPANSIISIPPNKKPPPYFRK